MTKLARASEMPSAPSRLRRLTIAVAAVLVVAAGPAVADVSTETAAATETPEVSAAGPASAPAPNPTLTAAQAPAPREAVTAVDLLHVALLASMKDASTRSYEERYAALEPVLTESFDLDFMARKSVGRHWRELGETDRELWQRCFARLMASTYTGRFSGYAGEDFEILGEEPAIHETVIVKTMLRLPDDDDVQLHYRLHETENGWRIIDVYMNGTVSELALRRSEYSSVLKRDGFDALVATLDSKANEYASAN